MHSSSTARLIITALGMGLALASGAAPAHAAQAAIATPSKPNNAAGFQTKLNAFLKKWHAGQSKECAYAFAKDQAAGGEISCEEANKAFGDHTRLTFRFKSQAMEFQPDTIVITITSFWRVASPEKSKPPASQIREEIFTCSRSDEPLIFKYSVQDVTQKIRAKSQAFIEKSRKQMDDANLPLSRKIPIGLSLAMEMWQMGSFEELWPLLKHLDELGARQERVYAIQLDEIVNRLQAEYPASGPYETLLQAQPRELESIPPSESSKALQAIRNQLAADYLTRQAGMNRVLTLQDGKYHLSPGLTVLIVPTTMPSETDRNTGIKKLRSIILELTDDRRKNIAAPLEVVGLQLPITGDSLSGERNLAEMSRVYTRNPSSLAAAARADLAALLKKAKSDDYQKVVEDAVSKLHLKELDFSRDAEARKTLPAHFNFVRPETFLLYSAAEFRREKSEIKNAAELYRSVIKVDPSSPLAWESMSRLVEMDADSALQDQKSIDLLLSAWPAVWGVTQPATDGASPTELRKQLAEMFHEKH